MNAALQRLRAEVRFDREAFEARVGELRDIDLEGSPAAPATRAQTAVALHHAYSAIESLLLRVTRQIEGPLAEAADWHQALLHAAGLEVPGVRPALLSRRSVETLRRLLGFRHFFRHAYAVELDPAQLETLRRTTLELAARLGPELDALDAFLERLAAEAP